MSSEAPNVLMSALMQVQDTPAALFQVLPEAIVWEESERVFTDQDLLYAVGVTLAQAIGESLDRIVDHDAATRALGIALRPTTYSLVYHYAQAAVLANAANWDSAAATRFFDLFKAGYRQNSGDGNAHIGTLALTGLTMLGMIRNEARLYNKALGLLLSDFPPLPDEPDIPAPLGCAALHLLGRCYDFQPQEAAIPSTIEAYVNHANREVAAEAMYNLGLTRLHDAFRAPNEASLRSGLLEARALLSGVIQAEENRTDAQLLYHVVNCYLAFMTGEPREFVTHAATEAREVFIERVLYMEPGESAAKAMLEWSLVQLLNWLAVWLLEMEDATSWPDIVPPMQILAGVYSGIRGLEPTPGMVGAAARAAQSYLLPPAIPVQFYRLQNMSRKLQKLLAEPRWRRAASAQEVEFYEVVLKQLQSVSPKADAAASLGTVIAAAQRSSPVLAEEVQGMVDSGIAADEILENLLIRLLPSGSETAVDPLFAELFGRLAGDLRRWLRWDERSPQWADLLVALGSVVRYSLWVARTGSRLVDAEGITFLYAKDSSVKGYGQAASESNLETNLQKWIALNDYGLRLDRQPEGRVPGRPDLMLVTAHGFSFPVEVKREFKDISHEHIRSAMLTQPQMYAAAAHQVAFQLVLDLRDKSPAQGFEPINIANRCYIDRVDTAATTYADVVVVAIIEGNRHLPNEYSSYSAKPRSSAGRKKRAG